jgi:hypothetical protein
MVVFGIQLNEYNYYLEFQERFNKVMERQKNSLNPQDFVWQKDLLKT